MRESQLDMLRFWSAVFTQNLDAVKVFIAEGADFKEMYHFTASVAGLKGYWEMLDYFMELDTADYFHTLQHPEYPGAAPCDVISRREEFEAHRRALHPEPPQSSLIAQHSIFSSTKDTTGLRRRRTPKDPQRSHPIEMQNFGPISTVPDPAS